MFVTAHATRDVGKPDYFYTKVLELRRVNVSGESLTVRLCIMCFMVNGDAVLGQNSLLKFLRLEIRTASECDNEMVCLFRHKNVFWFV